MITSPRNPTKEGFLPSLPAGNRRISIFNINIHPMQYSIFNKSFTQPKSSEPYSLFVLLSISECLYVFVRSFVSCGACVANPPV